MRLKIQRFVRLASAAAFLLAAAVAARAQALVVEDTTLNVTIGAKSYRLEAVVVRPAQASGRLPIALITHGKSREAEKNKKMAARGMLRQARDFAYRGWLAVAVVRRGFGTSDGPQVRGVSCATQEFRRNFESSADDLAAALEVIARRPDADPNRAIAIGSSAGGAAVLALAARNPAGLVGVVNVSGGLRVIRQGKVCEWGPHYFSTFSTLGRRARVPALWLYAENDSFFPPGLVRRMHAAYSGAGSRAELHMLTPVGDDGHRLWSQFEGRRAWLAPLDGFLRANGLPSWDPARLQAAIEAGRIAEKSRPTMERYFAAPSEKALAVSRSGRYVHFWSGGELSAMREKSLASCRERAREPCAILLENFDLIGGRRPDGR